MTHSLLSLIQFVGRAIVEYLNTINSNGKNCDYYEIIGKFAATFIKHVKSNKKNGSNR